VNDPLVSVVITAYNVAQYLPETLASVLAQTHARREIIVVDDGSTDNLGESLARFEDSITLIHQDNAGLGAARNRGLREVTGDYVAFLDADDLWEPSTLTRQLAVAHRHPEAGVVVCDGYQIGRKNGASRLIDGPLRDELDTAGDGEIVVDAYPTLLRHHTFFCPAQGLLRRSVVDELGPVATGRNTAPDYDYNLRAAQRFLIAVHAAPLVRYRYRPDSLSGPPERQGLPAVEHALSVLAAHLPTCRPEQAAFLDRRIVIEFDRIAATLYHYGVDHDRRFARDVLGRLRRLRPSDRSVFLASVALAIPRFADPVVARLIGRTRGLRRLVVLRRALRSQSG
jgi:glycosyltransferase involved in cell wall biosynthesis